MEIMKITETWVKLPQGGSFIYEYNTTGSLFEIRTNNVTITSDISHKLYIPEDVDVEIRSVSGEKKISFIPLNTLKPTKEFLEKYGDLVDLISQKTQQQDAKIDTVTKQIESQVELLNNKYDDVLSKVETKAEKEEVDTLKNTINKKDTQLQEQLQSHSELINTKTDEERVRALIAEAELDDLTIEQVQEEVIKRVADKASTQAMTEANEAQDAKIEAKADISYVDDIKESLLSKANKNELQEVKDILETKVSNTELSAGLQNKVNTTTFNQKVSEITQNIEIKADKNHTHLISDINGLSDALSTKATNETVNNLQEQVQFHFELISGKLDEEAVKVLIAEAELDDLTLEQVQQEVIKNVADKASSEAVNEANRKQDDKINQALLDIQELKKEPEIVEIDYNDEALFVKEYGKNTMYGDSNRYLKIGNYYIPFFVKKLFKVKQDAFDLELVKGEKYSINVDKFIENDGRLLGVNLESNNEQVTSGGISVDIEVSGSTTATLTHNHLDKPIVLNITAVDGINMQKVADSLEFTTGYYGKGLKFNHILPATIKVDAIKYVFDREVLGGRNSSYEVFTNPEGENNALIIDGQNSIPNRNNELIGSFPSSINASLIKVEIIKNGQSYVKTFEPQEIVATKAGV